MAFWVVTLYGLVGGYKYFGEKILKTEAECSIKTPVSSYKTTLYHGPE
jgi:hypothetical protein